VNGGFTVASKYKWRAAEKKPVGVSFRGPYYDTDEIETIEGDYEIDEEYLEEHEGYVIIEGVQGEKYPCALDIFREAYRLPEGSEAILGSQRVSKGGRRDG
jgi:hypothetical protein